MQLAIVFIRFLFLLEPAEKRDVGLSRHQISHNNSSKRRSFNKQSLSILFIPFSLDNRPQQDIISQADSDIFHEEFMDETKSENIGNQ